MRVGRSPAISDSDSAKKLPLEAPSFTLSPSLQIFRRSPANLDYGSAEKLPSRGAYFYFLTVNANIIVMKEMFESSSTFGSYLERLRSNPFCFLISPIPCSIQSSNVS